MILSSLLYIFFVKKERETLINFSEYNNRASSFAHTEGSLKKNTDFFQKEKKKMEKMIYRKVI